jgi:polyhydroxyalkanoate synthesis regulator phasin
MDRPAQFTPPGAADARLGIRQMRQSIGRQHLHEARIASRRTRKGGFTAAVRGPLTREIAMKPIRLFGIWLIVCITAPAIAGTIYKWTGPDGKQHFSDKPPPDTISEYKVLEADPNASAPHSPSDKRRSSFDQMVEKAGHEAKDLERQRRDEAKARASEEKREAEARRKARIEPERQRIQKAIQELENRALGPTFSMGMKKSQIDALRKELKKLEESTE